MTLSRPIRSGVLCWLLLALAPAASASADHQEAASTPAPTMVSTIMPWWRMIEQSFLSAAEALPEDKWSFAPGQGAFQGVRTFAEQVKHVACANYAFFMQIEKKTPPDACEKGGPDPARTKAELIKYLADSFTYAAEVISHMTPDNALEAAGGRYGGQSTRLGLTTLAVWHASDHYGQIVVYLRMNGIVPPASR
jgi:uncharacterized damage-inducible protein DinB